MKIRIMKILLFGANGAIGVHLLNKSLNNGDHVIAYVRRENAIKEKHENLEVVVGDLQNEKLIETLIARTDVVISTLGPHMSMARKIKSTPISDVHASIIKLMEKHGKKRFITIGTTTLNWENDVKHYSNTLLTLFPKILWPTAYLEQKKIAKIIPESNLDWTVVRFIDPKAKHNNNNEYRVSLEGKTTSISISRENIASFIHKVASEGTYVKQMPLIFH